MSRRKEIRRPRPVLKLHLEPLETRWLLSADANRPRPDRAAAPLERALESALQARLDASSFAHDLARHHRLAGDLGLGALSWALRRHEGYAARHGWGAALTGILHAHPHYAAAHHLTGLMAPRPAPAGGPSHPTLSRRPRPRRRPVLPRRDRPPRPPFRRRPSRRPHRPSSCGTPRPSPSGPPSTSPCRASARPTAG